MGVCDELCDDACGCSGEMERDDYLFSFCKPEESDKRVVVLYGTKSTMEHTLIK